MRIPNIFTEQALSENQEITLSGQAAQHISKALRMKAGQSVQLFNGDGYFYAATIRELGKKDLILRIDSKTAGTAESALETHLGQVMSRGDRMDYAIQKSTEMGVSEITPLSSERCELKVKSDREEKKIAHWQQVAISAAEQCGRASVPRINPVMSIDEWIKAQQGIGLNLVLHHRDQQQLTAIQNKPQHVKLLIGPEGGLSDNEIKLATQASFMATTFGPRVLRTETAPVAALALLQWLWGDYQ